MSIISGSIRGSVLITTLIFSAVIAIALGTFLQLALGSNKIADRSYAFNAAENLADATLERTLWCLNNSATPNIWTTGLFTVLSGGADPIAQATFTSDSLSRGSTGIAKVWINKSTDPTKPRVILKATITTASGAKVSKYVEAFMEQRSLSAGGMVARNGINFNGHSVTVDSWNSGNITPYSTAVGVQKSNARFASPALIDMQNAKVFGYAAIGTDDNSGLDIGASGILSGDLLAPNGTKDYTRVTHDFTASFPEIRAPSGGIALGSIGGNLTLVSGSYSTSGIDINNNTITVGSLATPANVILVVNGDIDLKGTATISIATGSTLTMYVSGNIDIGGNTGIVNGATNMNMPSSFTVIGTRTDADVRASSGHFSVWGIQGTSYLSAIIYGPNADVTIGGSGETFGSVVGNTVGMNSGNFHQDEWLSTNKTSGLWSVTKWREIQTIAERSIYDDGVNTRSFSAPFTGVLAF